MTAALAGVFSGGINFGDISLLGVDPAIGFFSGCVCASSAAAVPTLYGFSAKRHVEIANRAGNSLVSVGAGLLGFPGIWLGIGTAAGFVCKLLVVARALRPFAFKPIQAALKGRERIKAQSLEKLLGSMILSHGMLAVTALAPLTYIGYRYGENLTGQFALVLNIGPADDACRQCSRAGFTKELHSSLRMAAVLLSIAGQCQDASVHCCACVSVRCLDRSVSLLCSFLGRSGTSQARQPKFMRWRPRSPS